MYVRFSEKYTSSKRTVRRVDKNNGVLRERKKNCCIDCCVTEHLEFCVEFAILNSLVIHRTQRRRLINLLLADGVKSVRKSKKRKRSARKFWVKPGRSNTWWLAFQKNKVLPTDWFENFRMSKESFKILC